MKIIVDAMGGDNAPGEIVRGSVAAADGLDVEIILVGKETEIKKCLNGENPNITVVNADEVIGCDDDPTVSIRTKKNSSLCVGLKMLADGQGDAFVSAGSTGAIVSGATLLVKRISGIRRAAIGSVIPTAKGATLLMDCGANADCTEEFLQQFAIMGSAYAEALMNVDNPRIGLLNNGAEESKGSKVVRAAHELLKITPVNFIGNIEAREVLNGVTDVLIADGFSGNIFLKSVEGTAKYFSGELKTIFKKNIFTMLCALVLRSGIAALKDRLDADKYGGAPILGVDGVVIKAHGSSNADAFYNAVRQASEFVKKDVVGVIKRKI